MINFLISFPRSGQHLTSGILEWLHEKNNLDYGYCEFYSCCRSVPCKKGHNFQKNHDFWLEQNNNLLKIIEPHKYLVLYREDIILQLEAYYRYEIRVNNKPYIYSDLIEFIQKNKEYYERFIDKWINNSNSNVYKVEYFELVKNPNHYFDEIMRFFYPNHEGEFFNEDLFEVEFDIDNGSRKKEKRKIQLRNNLSDEVYQKIKTDLNI